jgi:hypothetical protein
VNQAHARCIRAAAVVRQQRPPIPIHIPIPISVSVSISVCISGDVRSVGGGGVRAHSQGGRDGIPASCNVRINRPVGGCRGPIAIALRAGGACGDRGVVLVQWSGRDVSGPPHGAPAFCGSSLNVVFVVAVVVVALLRCAFWWLRYSCRCFKAGRGGCAFCLRNFLYGVANKESGRGSGRGRGRRGPGIEEQR